MTIPGPSGLQVFSCFNRIRKNYAEAYDWLYQTYGPIAKFSRPFSAVVFFEPKDFSHVLKKNASNYKKSHHYEILRRFLGEGLVTSEGETWRTHRRLMAPEFHLGRVKDFTPLMIRRTEELEAVWQKAADTGEIRDLEKDLARLTLFIAGEALFGTNTDQFSEQVSESLQTGLETTTTETFLPFRLPAWVPTLGRWRSRRASERIDAVVEQVIALRESSSTRSGADVGGIDLLSRLLKAFREGQPKLSKQALIDEIKTLMLAGHETTTVALVWMFYLLAKNPDIRAKMKSASDTYVTWVVQESMRLKPPVPAVSKVAIDDDEIGGFRIPKGQLVVVSPFVTHRLPHVWKDAETFRPERFETLSPAEEAAYIPFVYGPRNCIGEHFAMIETQVILQRLTQRFVVDLVDPSDVGTNPLLTLRPDRKIYVKIRNA